MASYDPQRNRMRARPVEAETAPVDLLLDGAAEPVVASPEATSVPPAAAEHAVADVPAHTHGADCEHGSGGFDPRVLAVAAAATIAAVVAVAVRRRRSR